MKIIFKTSILILLLLHFSCKSNDSVDSLGRYDNGFFITNEGPFNNGTGTLTFVSNDFETVEQNVYQNVNNQYLGNIVQSMYFHENRAYIVANNSHKITVTDRYSMEHIATIEGDFINNPRYFVAKENIGYVSNWGNAPDPNDDFISVINLSTFELITTIPVGEGPEKMLLANNKLYVLLQGGWHFNNKLLVLNLDDNTITNTITIGDFPIDILQDNQNVIWILCAGFPSYAPLETSGKLLKMNNTSILENFEFPTNKHPLHLTLDNQILYYNLDNKVHTFAIANNTSLLINPIENMAGNFYAMKAHKHKLYVTDAGNYNEEGTLFIYNLENLSLEKTITTGIVSGSIVFQE